MSTIFPHQQIRHLLLQYLSYHDSGQFSKIVSGVFELAKSKSLYSGSSQKTYRTGGYDLDSNDYNIVPEKIRQLLWELLIQGIIVFGMNDSNPEWPWYRVTEYGNQVLSNLTPSPYDPDGFLSEFNTKNPNVDETIVDYLIEAIYSFNHNCYKSASVMLGCASEQAILLLHEKFESAIEPEKDKEKFQKSYKWTISSKFNSLRNELEFMIDSKKIPKELHEPVKNELISVFELIRRHRNSAGHPNLLKDIRRENLFLNLAIFSEYISQIYKLIDYFDKNKAIIK